MMRWILIALLTLGPGLAYGDDAARILVFGGTGRLGSDVVKVLVEEGHDVTVFARETSDRYRLNAVDVEYQIGDVLDAVSVDAALNADQFDVVAVCLWPEDGPPTFRYRHTSQLDRDATFGDRLKAIQRIDEKNS